MWNKSAFGSRDAENDGTEPGIRKYNALGKTGLKVSDISFGGADVFSENVVRYAFDLGVDLYDTAESYQGGRSEEIIGKGLQGVRDKAIILTKYSFHRQPSETIQEVTGQIETSLKRMNTDYIDIAFFYHGVNDPRQIKNDLLMEAAGRLKRGGKIRFTEFSTHNARETLAECVKPEYKDYIDVVLFIYNHIDGAPIEELVKLVHEARIGTIAMKSRAGGKQSGLKSFVNEEQTYETAALKWVLGNPCVDSTVISMKTYSHVDRYIKASGQKMDRPDLSLLRRYRDEVDEVYCRLECNVCEAFCPDRVAISDIMRYGMYFEDYRREKAPIQEYARLDDAQKPRNCATRWAKRAWSNNRPKKDGAGKTSRRRVYIGFGSGRVRHYSNLMPRIPVSDSHQKTRNGLVSGLFPGVPLVFSARCRS